MAKIVIVGAGMMGTATAFPLADNGHSVHLVGTHLDNEIIQSCKEQHYHPKLKRTIPPGVRPYFIEEIIEAMQGAEIIVSGVNSLGVHWIAQTIGPLLRPDQMIIAVTKGLEVDSGANWSSCPMYWLVSCREQFGIMSGWQLSAGRVLPASWQGEGRRA